MLRSLTEIQIPYSVYTHRLFNFIYFVSNTELKLEELKNLFFDNIPEVLNKQVIQHLSTFSKINWGTLYTLRRTHPAIRHKIDEYLRSDGVLILLDMTLRQMGDETNNTQIHHIAKLLHIAGVNLPSLIERLPRLSNTRLIQCEAALHDEMRTADPMIYDSKWWGLSREITNADVLAAPSKDEQDVILKIKSIRFLEKQLLKENKGDLSPCQSLIETANIFIDAIRAHKKNIILSQKDFLCVILLREIKAKLNETKPILFRAGFFDIKGAQPVFKHCISILNDANIHNEHKPLLVLILMTTAPYSKILTDVTASIYPSGMGKIIELLQLYKEVHFLGEHADKITSLLTACMQGKFSVNELANMLVPYHPVEYANVADAKPGDAYDNLCKVLVVSSHSAGRTSFISSAFLEGSITGDAHITQPTDFKISYVSFANKHLKFQIWDVANERGYSNKLNDIRLSAPNSCLRGAHAAVVCYDVTDETSFTVVEHYVNHLRESTFSNNRTPIILVGCKSDLAGEKMVDYNRGVELTERLGLTAFFECSALYHTNTIEILTSLTRAFYEFVNSENLKYLKSAGAEVLSPCPSKGPR